MIENNINSTGFQNEDKGDMVSVMELIALFLRHWYWIVVGIVLAMGGAYLYLRYTTPIYKVSSSVVLKEEGRKGSSAMPGTLEELAMMGSVSNVENELYILKSRSMIRSVINRLDLHTSYIVDDNPYETPMMIYPAIHYTMGGLWVDYELMTSIPGLFAIGEANFSDHGANRLGASALMQGLADGYFVLPYTIQNYLADQINVPRFKTDRPEFDEAEKGINDRIDRLMSIKGKHSVDHIHKELGHVMWDFVGMGRDAEGLKTAIEKLKEVKKDFWTNLRIPGNKETLNVELEKALRLADFIEIGELMAHDALDREESCGGHFRLEHQTPEGEALRHDDQFSYVSCWEYQGENNPPVMYKEPLEYEFVVRQQRNYKS
jgi:hypothetical protein